MLENAGLVRRTTRRGDRREYFSAPAAALESMLANAGALYRQLREIAERGLAATAERTPEARARLEEFRDVMAFVEQEIPRQISAFLKERAAAHGAGTVYPVGKEA
jgi:DNA-binding transcriptional regulator GbsR (MarR family)